MGSVKNKIKGDLIEKISGYKIKVIKDIKEYFEFCNVLGTGTYSKVHLVKFKQDDSHYAIKMIEEKYFKIFINEVDALSLIALSKSLSDPNIRTRAATSVADDVSKVVKKERRLSFNYTAVFKSKKTHENDSVYPIVKCIDYFKSENCYCILLDYIDGITLKEFISKFVSEGQRIDKTKFLNIAYYIFQSISIIHNASYAHRDIKCTNIMMGSHPCLIDFGFSQFIDDNAILKFPDFTGTLWYESPEIRDGRYISDPTLLFASDIYAAGITLYALSEGMSGPFLAKTKHELIEILKKPLVLTHPNKTVNNIISLCIAENPKNRSDATSILKYIESELYG